MTSIQFEAVRGRRVAVTHADSPIGRRLAKSLYHDPRVERIVALGAGPLPNGFEQFSRAGERRFSYARVDLARHRALTNFFNSTLLREARVDSLIYVPAHGWPRASVPPLAGGLAPQTAEARLILQHALELRGLENLVGLGSAFVYRLVPGNANLFSETSELDLAPDVATQIRGWIDADMIFQSELQNPTLRVVLLRVPTVVGAGGDIYLNPTVEASRGARLRPLGFDPICALISDKDVVRAIQLALRGSARGVFNIAGCESVPLSVLAHWTGRSSIPLPSGLISLASRLAGMMGASELPASSNAAHLRYGFTLDTSRARRELGFEPGYRIAPEPTADGRLQLESAPL